MSVKETIEIIKLANINDNKVSIEAKYEGIFLLRCQKSIDDIELPETLKLDLKEATYYEENLQVDLIHKETKEKVGVLDCKKPKKLIKKLK